MKRFRIALSIRAQLLLVLTVFLAIPWLGYEYVRELERFLRDAQERSLAGTAQAVATALHDRPRLFDAGSTKLGSLATERTSPTSAATESEPSETDVPDEIAEFANASPEIAQIIQGLSRTTARIWVIDRDLHVLARAGSLRHPPPEREVPAGSPFGWQSIERNLLHPVYAQVLKQPTDDFNEELAGRVLVRAHEVDGALSGILTTDRRPTPDGKAVIVSAAHPIWVGDEVRGAVIVEETTNAVLAERNRAFERLFTIVLVALLLGSVALTIYASRLSGRIRKLRDDAEAAIDAQGRARGTFPLSDAHDEIGDLSRSFSSALARLAHYAGYQQHLASRLSHELRTPIAVVRSSLDNLRLPASVDEAGVYLDRAQGGLDRLVRILTRMSEATRLEQSLRDVERERFDLVPVVSGCVDGYAQAYPAAAIAWHPPPAALFVDGAPDLVAQMLDKLVANAVEFSEPGAPIDVSLARRNGDAMLSVANLGPSLPEEVRGRLFDAMVSARTADSASGDAHLGLGLYIVRLIAEFHGGSARAENRDDGRGVVVTVSLSLADVEPGL